MIHTEAGLTASVGAGTGKLIAKIASGSRKPDGLVLVQPDTEADFLAPLQVGVIPGLGPKTEERLRNWPPCPRPKLLLTGWPRPAR